MSYKCALQSHMEVYVGVSDACDDHVPTHNTYMRVSQNTQPCAQNAPAKCPCTEPSLQNQCAEVHVEIQVLYNHDQKSSVARQDRLHYLPILPVWEISANGRFPAWITWLSTFEIMIASTRIIIITHRHTSTKSRLPHQHPPSSPSSPYITIIIALQSKHVCGLTILHHHRHHLRT